MFVCEVFYFFLNTSLRHPWVMPSEYIELPKVARVYALLIGLHNTGKYTNIHILICK